MPRFRHLIPFGALLGLTSVAPAIAADATQVSNTASLSFATPTGRQSVSSNTVSLDIDRTKRSTSLSFHLVPVGYQLSGFECQTTPTIVFTPAPIDAATLALAPSVAALDINQPMILVLDAQGSNHDPNVREQAIITVTTGQRTQQMPLLETGPNTGVFAGGLPQSGGEQQLSACDATLDRGGRLTLTFTEDAYSYGSTNSILVDPAGYVFDSATGALVNGTTVTLLDQSNQPAAVFGDDGTSRYPATVVSGTSATDSSGRVYSFSQGNYRFPLVAPGSYHLQFTPPANYTAPSTKSADQLAALRDPQGKAFVINAASFGNVFTLSTTAPFYTDVPVDRSGDTSLVLTKVASVRTASPGDFVQYHITLLNRGTAATSGVHLTDILPTGLRYQKGSTRGTVEPIVSTDGRDLDFAVGAVGAGSSVDVTYVVSIAPGAPVGEALNRVLASGSAGATSNEASAMVRITSLLFTDGFTLVGRVTQGGCNDPAAKRKGVHGIRILLEDGTFVSTDRDGLYHIEGIRPGRHVVQMDTASVPYTLEAVACGDDTRQAGSAISRFVESDGGLLKRVDFQLRPNGKAAKPAEGLLIPVATDAWAAGDRDWLTGQTPGIAMLFPELGHNPRAPQTRVVIKHLPDQRVALSINGTLTDPLLFDATDSDPAHTLSISHWNGLPLRPGDNTVSARVLAKDGSLVTTIERIVHVSGAATLATLVPDKGRLIADGLTRPLIAVRLTDRDGKPVREGTLVSFHVDQPYTAAFDVDLEQARALTGKGKSETTARVVGDEGLAFIALQPTTQAGNVHVSVILADDDTSRATDLRGRTIDIRAWLSASVKDWVVVGFGAGTLGYNTLHTHASGLPAATTNDVVTDGQIAFYAKGRILGKWLATIAYDNKRTYDRDRGLLGTIDPDKYYTVYGDGSRQGYDAATAGKLYVRLERRQFYAMFGDYETGMTETQLARYSRTLNGGKLAFEARRVSVTAFAAKTDQTYGRDEIQGNGLSGPYRLSGTNIVPNSDQVRIEVRDRFRSELIVSSTQMTRNIDYDIDTTLGTLRFKSPVLTRDSNLNPIFIVVDYENEGFANKLVAGGRVAARFAHNRVEVGVSAIHDETLGHATLIAADVKAKLTPQTEVRGEIATGGQYGLTTGQAFLAEVEHHDKTLDVTAYARDQDATFGVGQQNIVEAGTRKFGFDGRMKLTSHLSITASAWHQEELENPGSRDALDLRLELRRPTGTVFIGTQIALDRGRDGQDRDSRLLTLGGTQSLFDNKLALSAQTQIAPGGDKDSVDFPIRNQITASYRIQPGIRLIAGYEIADGTDYVAHTAQIGFDVAPWTGAKLMSTVNQQAVAENGQRTYAQYGLNQSLPLGKHWTVDATLDASSTVRGAIPTGAVINAFQPVSSGGSVGPASSMGTGSTADQNNGDYTAVTMGANYRAGMWSANGRIEYRNGTDEKRWGIKGNLLRTLGKGSTLASGIRYSKVTQASGDVASYLTADVALALRPLDSHWSVLERLQFRNEKADAGFTETNVLGVPAYGNGNQTTLRAINNLAVNYRSGAEGDRHNIEATVYYGAKWVRGAYADDDYTGFIDVIGFDVRQDIGKRFDIGVQGSVQHAWTEKVVSFSGGPSAGVSPGNNMWLSVGYNIAGYRDVDYQDDRYTRKGPYVTFRLKFDQRSIAQAVGRFR
jgi:uncharacterized repeat protein (TIGR01451 family)